MTVTRYWFASPEANLKQSTLALRAPMHCSRNLSLDARLPDPLARHDGHSQPQDPFAVFEVGQ